MNLTHSQVGDWTRFTGLGDIILTLINSYIITRNSCFKGNEWRAIKRRAIKGVALMLGGMLNFKKVNKQEASLVISAYTVRLFRAVSSLQQKNTWSQRRLKEEGETLLVTIPKTVNF